MSRNNIIGIITSGNQHVKEDLL